MKNKKIKRTHDSKLNKALWIVLHELLDETHKVIEDKREKLRVAK